MLQHHNSSSPNIKVSLLPSYGVVLVVQPPLVVAFMQYVYFTIYH